MIEHNTLKYEKLVLVGVITKQQGEENLKEYLKELEFLATTAGGNVIKQFTQKIEAINPKTYIGSGKIQDIFLYIKEHDINTVIFDDELTPAQQKNITQILKCKIIDRTRLILDIFAQRAQTSYATTQVELAQYEYLLPRLTGLWTHLERQKGGIGMRGPGETEIETDRRIVRDRISLLKKKLNAIDKQMKTQRGNRGSLVRVALIGYTNVGKSTLMNALSKSNVFVENKLFATLDTTVRKITIGNLPFLLSDTVGFIRKLPTQLVAAFKSTLDEVIEADILLHIVDISHLNFEKHIDSVNHILKDIKAIKKPTIIVFNKIDAYKNPEIDSTNINNNIDLLEKSWMSKQQPTIFISVIKKYNFESLKEHLYNAVREIHISRFPHNHFLYPDIVFSE